jgi:hypothetical protein
MTHYMYQGTKLTAKTDTGARRQVSALIAAGKVTAGDVIHFFRDSDYCRGTISR